MKTARVIPLSREHVLCPQCHSSDIARYMYGEPTTDADLDALIRARRVALGGCCVGEGDPAFRCNVCGVDFGPAADDPIPTRKSLEAFRVSLAPDGAEQAEWPVGRLVLTGSAAPEKPRPNPRVVLEAAIVELVRLDKKVRYLVTPAGFLRANAGPDVRLTSGWETCQSDFDTLRRVAEDIALHSLSGVLGVARGHASHLVVGVDVSVAGDDPYAEVALVIDVEEGTVVGGTGKTYPMTGKQERELVRNADVDSHVIDLPGDRIGVLVCHDLVAWTGRSAESRRGRRATVGRGLQDRVTAAKPNVVLHLPHTVERTGTWVAAWNELKREVGPGLRIWTSAIAYLTPRWRQPKVTPLRRGVRDRTRSSDRDVLDIIVGD
jgi:hypothetical protein